MTACLPIHHAPAPPAVRLSVLREAHGRRS